MILSAVALFKKIDTSEPLEAVAEEEIGFPSGFIREKVRYSGHRTKDGAVRIFAKYSRPLTGGKHPVMLFFSDAADAERERHEEELTAYFVKKGFAVLVPDYCGKPTGEANEAGRDEAKQLELVPREAEYTVYPPSLAYANYAEAGGLCALEDLAEQSCWFEWLHVALTSVEYLKTREDAGNIGVAGVRTGGEIAWKTMLSPDVKCGVPINAIGWQSYRQFAKFEENAEGKLSDERRRYIAGIESQSYAPFVKCPVLVLCAMREESLDYDRAYDTFSRIGCPEGSAIEYSSTSGSCIGPHGLKDMELFLEKNLKEREIYIPKPVLVSLAAENGEIEATAEFDEDGLMEEVGILYAEAGERTEAAFRNWQRVLKMDGKSVVGGKISAKIQPFEGAAYAFAYAYAKYINGFKIVSKIAVKKFERTEKRVVRSRVICSGGDTDCFGVASCVSSALGGVFLEDEAVPRRVEGYGKIMGTYSPAGIKTYKISSPRYVADEGAMLEFDAYSKQNNALLLTVEVAEAGGETKKYVFSVAVRGGGKWKRVIVPAKDFKNAETGEPLKSFSLGRALAFDGENEDAEFAVTNILWL